VYDASGLPLCCRIVTVPFFPRFRFSISSTVRLAPVYPARTPFTFTIRSHVTFAPPPLISTIVPFAFSIVSEVTGGAVTVTVPFSFTIDSTLINNTCGGAEWIVLNQFVGVYTRRRSNGGMQQWYRLSPKTPGATIFAIGKYPGPQPNVTYRVWVGSCGSLTELTLTPIQARCGQYVVPGGVPFWITVDITGPDEPDDWGFRLLSGSCAANGFPP
jgi:hypothetical protein